MPGYWGFSREMFKKSKEMQKSKTEDILIQEM